jgi:arylsulfatase A-like enzyme
VAVGDVLWLAISGAVLAALVHVASVEFRFRVLEVFTWTNREFAWLSLVGYLACFLLAAGPVVVVTVIARRWVGLRFVAACFATLAVLAMLLLYERIHPLGQVALALGVGVQVGGLIAATPALWLRRLRRVSIAGMLVLGVVGAVGRRTAGQAGVVSPAASASSDTMPNVILLIMDTVRAASLSLYGYARQTTPVLDRLARESTVFDRAFAVAPWTAPSHASMMTGLWASQTGADYLNPMFDSLTTVAHVLGQKGYATGGFMANTGYAGYQLGIARGFAHYEDFPVSFRQALLSTTLTQTNSGRLILDGLWNRQLWKILNGIGRPDLRSVKVRTAQPQYAAQIANNFFRWRGGIDAKPYFAMLNFMDAHAPYEPPDGFQRRFNDGKREIDRYDGGIAYEDSVIGDLVERLRANGDLDRTIIVVTADHGEQWGEHDLESHGNSLYLPLLHVPLLIRAPGRVPTGLRVSSIVSLRDLAATLIDLAGAEAGPVPGASLAHAWRDTGPGVLSPIVAEAAAVPNPSPQNLTKDGPIKGSIDSTWHYIRYGNNVEALFAWRTDTAELDDRSRTSEGMAAIQQHRSLIARALGTGWPPPRSRLH